MVKPTSVSLIPNAIAIAEALSTTKSPPSMIPTSPTIMKNMLLGRENFGFSTWVPSFDLRALSTK